MPGGPPVGVGQDGVGIVGGQVHRFWSARDIADLARDAGFRDDTASNDGQSVASGKVKRRDGNGYGRRSELHVIVAIALAESGGDRLAHNPSGAVGLWQICCTDDEAFYDPAANARAAWNKYVGAGYSFKPWSVFNSGAYLPKLPAAYVGVRVTHRDRPGFTGGGTGAVHDVIAFTGDIGRDLGTFFGFLTSGSTWIRLGESVAGAALIAFALWVLVGSTKTGERVQGQALQFAGGVAGKAAKAGVKA